MPPAWTTVGPAQRIPLTAGEAGLCSCPSVAHGARRRMARRRAGDTPTFKDMVAQLRAQPSPEPQPTRRTANFDRLYDRAGREWVPQVPWLEPHEVVELLHRRTPWVVEWCGGRLSWSDEEDDVVLSLDILTDLLTRW